MRAVECRACGEAFDATSPRAAYCSSTCRKRGNRAGVSVLEPKSEAPETSEEPALLTWTRTELEKANVLDSAIGQQALELARRMSDPRAMGMALAPISKELRAVMAEAMKVAPAASGLDELRSRRDRKRHTG